MPETNPMLELCKTYVHMRDHARELFVEMENETDPYRWNQLDRAYREVTDALHAYTRAAQFLSMCTPPKQMYLFREVIQQNRELHQKVQNT